MTMEDNKTESLEYVLGLLEGDERKRFEADLLDDPDLATEVWALEETFVPLASAVKDRPPPPRVFSKVETRLFGAALRQGRRRSSPTTAVWRWLASVFGLGFVGVLAALAVVLMRPEMIAPQGQADWVAAIVHTDGGITLARVRDDGQLVTEAVPLKDTATRAQLWLVPPDGTPRSLGLLARDGRSVVAISQAMDELLTPNSQLLITLEPAGGSPTGRPTGPEVGSGSLRRI
ncbi:MAG: anti-sigma factor [Devosia sp.]